MFLKSVELFLKTSIILCLLLYPDLLAISSMTKHRSMNTGAHFLKFPVITRPVKLLCFPFQMGVSKLLKTYTVKFSAKQTKWTSLEVRTHPTFLETSISK